MLTLAFESSAKPASVAVVEGGALLGQYFQNSGLTHSRTLLAMTESLLKNLDLSASDIGLVAVSSGPGSFTGVRIGVSAAKGFAWGAGIPVCGVSTLEAMACGCTAGAGEAGLFPCLLSPVMDARRDQVYNALFQWKEGTPSRLCQDRAISLDELAADLAGRNDDILLIGDGAALSHRHLGAVGIPCKTAPTLISFQTAYGVAIAAANTPSKKPADLIPSYLRPSQAELAMMGMGD